MKSRTEHITRNVFFSLVTQVLLLLFAFISRTIFIRLLGSEYLGLDGLFTSILTIFSLAELGIGNAIIFSLYKPIANADTFKAQQLLSLYKQAYKWISIAIAIIGILLIPFLPRIINADIDHLGINIYVVYILFLLNTLSSYFLAHRQAILVVNQEQSIVSVCQLYVKLLVYVLEVLVLLVYNSYYGFLIIKVAGNYLSAVYINHKAKIRYPKLCKANNYKLSSFEIRSIKKDVYALFLRRFGGVILSATDNIIINKFISLTMVGIYSNYILIQTSIQTITTQVMSSMTASIGNFVATQGKSNTEKAFNLYNYITYLVYGFCSISFILLANRFITLLWGDNYVLSKGTLYLIVFNFFLYGYQTALNTFRDTAGLFTQGKYRSLVSASFNLVFSLLLVRPLGVSGVVIGTILSRILVSSWYDSFILYKHLFKKSFAPYIKKLILYILIVFLNASILDWITTFIPDNIAGFILCIIVSLLSVGLLIIPLQMCEESKDFFSRMNNIVHNLIYK